MKYLKSFKQINESIHNCNDLKILSLLHEGANTLNTDRLVKKIKEYFKKFEIHEPLDVKSIDDDNIEFTWSKFWRTVTIVSDEKYLNHYMEVTVEDLGKYLGFTYKLSKSESTDDNYVINLQILSTYKII